jgi:site-specific recombinase XerC
MSDLHATSLLKVAPEIAAMFRTDPVLAAFLRDRALIAVMVYSFARVSAALGMRVEDYDLEGRRAWFRLHEKGGKRHHVPNETHDDLPGPSPTQCQAERQGARDPRAVDTSGKAGDRRVLMTGIDWA